MTKKFILFFILVSCFFTAQQKMIVNTKLLNVRAGAGTKYEVVDQVASGTSVLVLEKKGNWYRVDLQNGIKGYVNQKFLSLPVQKIMNKKKEGESYGWKFWAILIGLFLFGLFRKRYSSSSTKYSMAENQENETFPRSSTVNSINSDADSESDSNSGYICKCCGQKYKSLHTLTFMSCSRSPTRKHIAFEGGIQKRYICEYCGQENNSLGSLVFHSCSHSPTKKHIPYIGGVQDAYSCKHCGQEYRKLSTLTFMSCHRSPSGKHEPQI
jgi:DNA-directed RNA polymerase subunit RPC12/RpoP